MSLARERKDCCTSVELTKVQYAYHSRAARIQFLLTNPGFPLSRE